MASKDGSFTGYPELLKEGSRDRHLSLWGSAGQPRVGSSTGDFERWLKGVLEVVHFSLWELCEGNLEGGLPCWGPWRIGRKRSGEGHLFP
jgi:hypothetical protein